MPFLRQTRDKRGYECTYVMHAYRPASPEGSRTRVLYMFRSPAHLRLGRHPLDAEVMEALERTHPDLSFDWNALQRDPGVRHEAPERSVRPAAPRGASRPTPRSPPPPAAPPVRITDDSLLGRTLGADDAARLRQRYQDLLQRIARRARTPEDRDRLSERALRLNPDEWPDEATVRANAQSAGAEWDAIAAELPSRRRGRRGGRRRSQAPSAGMLAAVAEPAGPEAGAGAPDDGSGIMDGGEHADAGPESSYVDPPYRDASAAGDGGRVGPDDPTDATDARFPVDD
jgi:hypothetical protein